MQLSPASSRVFLLAFLAASCSSGGGDDSSASRFQGLISLPAGSSGSVLEAEPNDTVDQAHFLGQLLSGDTLEVLGNTTDDGSDPFDGFELQAPERVRVSVSLSFDAGNDFDISVFDPVSLQFVESFLTTSIPEVGTFHAKGVFDLVLNSFSGAGAYRLTITAAAAADPIQEREPNDMAGEAQYLGETLVGDGADLGGTLDLPGGDGVDRWLLAFPEETTLDFVLSGPPGADFDLALFDATADLSNPDPLGSFDSPPGTPLSGSFAVPAMTLVELDVTVSAGSGGYLLELTTSAPLSGGGAFTARRPAALQLERGGGRRGAIEAFYGRPAHAAVAGEFLVLPQDEAALARLLRARGLRHLDGIPGGAQRVGFGLQPGWSAEDAQRATLAVMRSVRGLSGVRSAEPNFVLRPLEVPDDPFFNLQWHYSLIQLPATWDLTTGSGAVLSAVIDTGETAHPDLVANQIAGYDFISDPNIAGDGDGRDSDPTDVGDGNALQPSSFHGTHVAGTIGAQTDNGVGVAGVNWQGKIMHLRALGIGGGTLFDIENALLYAGGLPNSSGTFPPQRADIVNMSLGGGGFSQSFQNSVNQVRAQGVTIFAAAGNENSSTPSYPAAYAGVISVAAVDTNGDRAPYSNFHATVDLAAPGGNTAADLNGDGYADGVLSTLADDSSSPLAYNYVFYQGTSMACPHAAGVAGLMLAVDPTLTPDELESILTSTATDLGVPGRDNLYGHGLINAFQAVSQAAGGAPTDPVLGLSTKNLAFEGDVDVLSVQVSNVGGGLLQVTSVTASTGSGGNWLSASAVPAQNPTTTDTTSIRVEVDASGLPDGLYSGAVALTTNSPTTPTEAIAVSLLVAPDAPIDVDIFVLVVEFDAQGDPTTVAQDVVNPTTDLSYSLAGIPAGTYLLVAGSDDNDDGFICGEGDTYCGLYPTVDEPVLVTIAGGETLAGLDLTLVDQGATVENAGAGTAGWRRLR